MEIPPSVIKKAWAVYQEEITRLFHRCLEEGYHPYDKRYGRMSCMIDKKGGRGPDYVQERTGHSLLEFQPRHDPSTPTLPLRPRLIDSHILDALRYSHCCEI